MEKITALLVEDDNVAANQIKMTLENSGLVQIGKVAKGATEALEILRNDKPQLLLLDLSLIEGSGMPLASKIHAGEAGYQPCIIVVTGTSTPAVHQMLNAKGVNAIFDKSKNDYSPKNILQWIRTHLDYIPQKQEATLV